MKAKNKGNKSKHNKINAAVMFSGGLDSRLIIKILQEQGLNVIALHFKLPFSKDEETSIKKFCKEHDVKLKIFDYTKGRLFKEYLNMLKNPSFGRGRGANPCIDCRLFMVKKAKEFIDEKGIEFLATGEVLGQRPMSQHKKGLDIVEKESGLDNRLIRPLIEQGIKGRNRQKQIALAKKHKIDYPNPAGGCLLCERALVKRFDYLFKRGLEDYEAKLLNIGRHFVINDVWVVLGRNKKENELIEKIAKKSQLVFPDKDVMGPTAVILNKTNEKTRGKVKKLVRAYSKGSNSKEQERFKKYAL